MQYILILWVLWADPYPYPHYETLIVESFNTLAECTEAGTRIGDASKVDGAISYKVFCEPSQDMKT